MNRRAHRASSPLTLAVLLLAGAASQLEAQDDNDPGDPGDRAATFAEAFQEGKVSLQLRYRWEQVDDDTPAVAVQSARASTLRTTLGFNSKMWRGWSFSLTAEDVAPIGAETYNNAGAGSLDNGVRDRPVIADPDNTEISQFIVGYQLAESTSVRFGRMELSLDNERFVGAVGWRQNHQELDAFAIDSRPGENWRVQYAYLDRAHTVTGAEQGMASHLINLARTGDAGSLTAYSYWLDYDDPALATLSTASSGLRFQGERPLGEHTGLLYEAEIAQQQDSGNSPASIDLGYRKLELGTALKKSGITLRAGLEILEGNGMRGFRTPLATLHKFNGFADKFLVTPAAGLEDLYAGIWAKKGSLAALLVFHDFSAESNQQDYGTELDFQLLYTTAWKQILGLKVASYQAAGFSADTNKLMIWTQWGF